jgi:hypothetical protein
MDRDLDHDDDVECPRPVVVHYFLLACVEFCLFILLPNQKRGKTLPDLMQDADGCQTVMRLHDIDSHPFSYHTSRIAFWTGR